MEDNYLIRSKKHTKAIATILENIVAQKRASISDYYGIFINWLSWFHINEAMYENLSDPNKGEQIGIVAMLLSCIPKGM